MIGRVTVVKCGLKGVTYVSYGWRSVSLNVTLDLPAYALLLQLLHSSWQLTRLEEKVLLFVRLKVINNATCLTLFMETADKIALSHTVKHGVLSLLSMFLG